MSLVDNNRTVCISARSFSDAADFWRVRQLLVETYPITPPGFNWEIRRWDGWRFHRENPTITPFWTQHIQLWETPAQQLVAVAHPESDGDVFFEVHPDYRYLEQTMLAWAEKHLAAPVPASAQRSLEMFVYDYDMFRQRLLTSSGYTPTPHGGVLRRMRLGQASLPKPNALPEGYCLRETAANEADYQGIASLLNAAFNRTCHTADEYHNFTFWSPSFDHRLNLVALTCEGQFAAHVGITYNEVNQYAVIEPVCTHPAHRRKNLARTLIQEGMRRVQRLGAQVVYVGTGDDRAANALYDAVGFTEAYKGYTWCKTF